MTTVLRTPVTAADAGALVAGDVVFVSGRIVTGRDSTHAMLLDEAIPKPGMLLDALQGGVIYHCGPVARQGTGGAWSIEAAGPTTSARMNKVQSRVLQRHDLHAVIGKGGMSGVDWGAAGAVYLAFTGGAALVARKAIRAVAGVAWLEELGVPEAAWILDVEKFGPLIVASDTLGNDLYARVIEASRSNPVPGPRHGC